MTTAPLLPLASLFHKHGTLVSSETWCVSCHKILSTAMAPTTSLKKDHYYEDEPIPYRRSTFSGRIRSRAGRKASHIYLLETIYDYPHYSEQIFMGSEFATCLSHVFHARRDFESSHPVELTGFSSRDRFGTSCIPYQVVRRKCDEGRVVDAESKRAQLSHS
jgi:hypothetical protein